MGHLKQRSTYYFLFAFAISTLFGCESAAKGWEYQPDFYMKLRWGGAISRKVNEIIVDGKGSCDYIEYRIGDDRTQTIVSKNTFHLEAVQIVALKRTIMSTDFFNLQHRYSDEPKHPIIAKKAKEGDWALSFPGGTFDGWYIEIAITADLKTNQVWLANGSLNAFHTIIRNLHTISDILRENVQEPQGWMEEEITEYIKTTK